MSRHLIARAPHQRLVHVDVELTADRLSISGDVGTAAQLRRGDFDTGGQCDDAIRAALEAGELQPVEPWTADTIRHLLDVWQRWHLNDMRAGCEHQRAGVAVEPGDPSEGTPWNERPIDPEKPTDTYGKHFPGQRHDSWNLLGWIRPDEHPDGLLARECPTCGYGYGTAWRTEELPADVREWAAAL